jgi:hypothetical protein
MALQTAPPEALFRCISLVLCDNAFNEFQFVQSFFSRPADVPSSRESVSDKSWDVLSRNDSFLSSANGSMDDAASTGDDSASVVTTSEVPGLPREKKDKSKRSTEETVWNSVMVPVLEYCKVSQVARSGEEYRWVGSHRASWLPCSTHHLPLSQCWL